MRNDLSTMSITQLQDRIRRFGVRGVSLCGQTVDGKPLGATVKQYFDDLLVSITDPAAIEQGNKFRASAETDPALVSTSYSLKLRKASSLATQSVMRMGIWRAAWFSA